jgi:hypothetical protein
MPGQTSPWLKELLLAYKRIEKWREISRTQKEQWCSYLESKHSVCNRAQKRYTVALIKLIKAITLGVKLIILKKKKKQGFNRIIVQHHPCNKIINI